MTMCYLGSIYVPIKWRDTLQMKEKQESKNSNKNRTELRKNTSYDVFVAAAITGYLSANHPLFDTTHLVDWADEIAISMIERKYGK